MSGISHIFNIARSGIQAHQQGISTTSHNIANIDTKGYSRQQVVLETNRPAEGVIGSGVQVGEVRRVVDVFLEDQLTAVTEELGFATARNNFLIQADGIFTETENTGLSLAISEFFNALRDVATNPESTIQRTVLFAKADSLVAGMVSHAQGLQQIRLDANREIERHVETINGLAIRIASLNDEIFKAESSGREAPDLRDQRTVLLNEMAGLVEVEQVQMRDGIGIMVGGQLLVGGNHANALATIPDADNPPLHDVGFVRSDGSVFAISDHIEGGEIGGLLTLRDTDIVGFQDRLDRLAAVLVNEFNLQHQSGFGLDGSTALNFFTSLTPNAPLAHDRNVGTVTGNSVTITDPTLLTFQNYELQFTGPTAYTIIERETGGTVGSGTYSSGTPISIDGLDVLLTGTPALGDRFQFSAHGGAAGMLSRSLTNTDQVAAAGSLAGLPGDNTNSLALIGLHTGRHNVLGDITLNDYHTITMGNVGSTTRESEVSLTTTTAEAEQVKKLREGVSGVSLDEELANLLTFQRSFEASARMITVADELFQTILGMGR